MKWKKATSFCPSIHLAGNAVSAARCCQTASAAGEAEPGILGPPWASPLHTPATVPREPAGPATPALLAYESVTHSFLCGTSDTLSLSLSLTHTHTHTHTLQLTHSQKEKNCVHNCVSISVCMCDIYCSYAYLSTYLSST